MFLCFCLLLRSEIESKIQRWSSKIADFENLKELKKEIEKCESDLNQFWIFRENRWDEWNMPEFLVWTENTCNGKFKNLIPEKLENIHILPFHLTKLSTTTFYHVGLFKFTRSY